MQLCHTKTAACTHDIISNVPAITNRRDVFVCTLLHHELHNTCQYILDK